MFIIKYNIISGIILLVQVLSVAMIYFEFGASQESDILLIAISTIGAAHLVQVMPIDQFMVYYHKQTTRSDKKNLWHYSLTISLAIGLSSFIIAVLSILYINSLEFNGISQAKKYYDVAIILAVALIFYPVLFLNDKLFNSKECFVASYMLTSLTQISVFLSLIFLHLIKSNNITIIAWGYVGGVTIGALLSTAIISNKLGYGLKLTFNQKNKFKFHKNSIQMRIGHNIVGVLFPPLTNNFLVGLPVGNASLFHYAYRAVIAVFSITAGPMFKLYMSKLSQFWATEDLDKAKNVGVEYHKKSMSLYFFVFLASILILLIIHKLIPSIFSEKINASQSIDFMKIYLLLGLWQAIVLVESKYVGILIVSESSSNFIKVNLVFIIVYALCSYILSEYLSVYAIATSAIFAQSINLFMYEKYAMLKFDF